MDLDSYWNLNPKQFEKHISNYEEKQLEKANYDRVLIYNLGYYILLAFNKPNDYPEKPELLKLHNDKPMDDDEMEKIIERNTYALGGEVVNDNR